jgi:hypothetical protein
MQLLYSIVCCRKGARRNGIYITRLAVCNRGSTFVTVTYTSNSEGRVCRGVGFLLISYLHQFIATCKCTAAFDFLRNRLSAPPGFCLQGNSKHVWIESYWYFWRWASFLRWSRRGLVGLLCDKRPDARCLLSCLIRLLVFQIQCATWSTKLWWVYT